MSSKWVLLVHQNTHHAVVPLLGGSTNRKAGQGLPAHIFNLAGLGFAVDAATMREVPVCKFLSVGCASPPGHCCIFKDSARHVEKYGAG